MPLPFAVIMAGGRGERLWPLSTPERPKQFLRLGGQQTMLQETVSRISPLIPEENIYVVTLKEFRGLVLEQLAIPKENVIAEPLGLNTAPCVGLAAVMLEAKDPQGVMIVLPADHAIKETERFLEILKRAIKVASTGDYLITLGIVPDHPTTGYGYIRRGELIAENDGISVYRVQSFTEKPDKESAKYFLEKGGYYWNSGMFIWRADVILTEIKKHIPKLHQGLMEIKAHLGAPDLDEVITKVYKEQEPISIDYGVLERSSRALMIPGDIGWSDVGDWSALDAIFPKDREGNIIQAKWLGMDTKNSTIFSEDKTRVIATIGVEDIVIIDAGSALLVIDKRRAQEVRKIAQQADENRKDIFQTIEPLKKSL
jgi:mannose-1-phosphate guanylyltransferase